MRRGARILLRNVIVWTASLLAYCVIDYVYVRHGPATVAWAEWAFLPAFYAAVLWANKDLFSSEKGWIARWSAVAGVSLGLAFLGGFLLLMIGIWFHFSIGGKL